jgi:DNA-directed RNA polymerase specialized sigma24 family protein
MWRATLDDLTRGMPLALARVARFNLARARLPTFRGMTPEEIAADIVSEGWQAYLEAREGGHGEEDAARLAGNAMKSFRTQTREEGFPGTLCDGDRWEHTIAEDEPDVDPSWGADELLAQLPADLRRVAELKMEDLADERVAKVLGISRQTAQRRWDEARNLLTAGLGRIEAEGRLRRENAGTQAWRRNAHAWADAVASGEVNGQEGVSCELPPGWSLEWVRGRPELREDDSMRKPSSVHAGIDENGEGYIVRLIGFDGPRRKTGT